MLRSVSALLLASGLGLSVLGGQGGSDGRSPFHRATVGYGPGEAFPTVGESRSDQMGDVNDVVDEYCVRCHNERRLRGNMSLEAFDVANAAGTPELAEKVIRKLTAGMMPPSGAKRPEESVLLELSRSLEGQLDRAAAEAPNPGRRTFQRLNRAEYEASIRQLLQLDIDAGDFLPLDTKSAGFDNIADAQLLSATLMDGYLRAASEISRLAVGDPLATPTESTYRVSRRASQTEQVTGAPFGSRGGVAVRHTFPADGEYSFRVSFHHETTGALFGNGRNALHTDEENPELLEISIDGEAVALLEVGRWMHTSDPDGVNLRSEPVFITAGPKQVAAAFVRRYEGPAQDLISPHEWSLASTSIAGSYGFTSLPHLRDLAIRGPARATGISETPSRQALFTCQAETPACAREILERTASRAYRRPLGEDETTRLMGLFEVGAVDGFEEGVRLALEGILASPNFVFRFEEPGEAASGGSVYRITDLDLASRLSFFLWGTGPDDELIQTAAAGRLSQDDVRTAQVRRMLADERAGALATRFGAQWLRLQDLDRLEPDPRLNPDFDEQVKSGMRTETELFFEHLVREDRSALELFTADYTFVNERLAKHYGMTGVAGDYFRQVKYPDQRRRGLLGHGSVLTLTSHADRTSPVLRGKWVMEVLLGSPPPPPPPDVPELEDTESAENGRFLTVRERMEIHRANPSCNSCHRMMDPIGLALENFDITGVWRIKDQGMPIDAAGELYDGTPISTPSDLRNALLARPEPMLRTFTENLMAYALGRRLEYYDMPTVRRVVREAAADDYRLSSFILGVVNSDAFQQKAGPALTEQAEGTDS